MSDDRTWWEHFGERLHERLGQLRVAPRDAGEWGGVLSSVAEGLFTSPPPTMPAGLERIACVAIMQTNGALWALPRPRRHVDVIALINEAMKVQRGELYYFAKNGREFAQGFLTTNGRFVDREEAKSIAREACQLVDKPGREGTRCLPELYSEDVW